MSQLSRQHLSTDAEKLYAAHQLWLYHSQLLNAGITQSVLNEVVYTYMHEVGEGHHEDYMRAFFRLRVEDIASIFPQVISIVRSSSHDMTRDLPTALVQANAIILVCKCLLRFCLLIPSHLFFGLADCVATCHKL